MIHIIYNKVAGIATIEMAPMTGMGRYHARFDRQGLLWAAGAVLGMAVFAILAPGSARAAPSFVSCGGAAMLGGAQLNCSHLAPAKPAQLCNFSWSLLLPNNVPQVVSGSFLLPKGSNNAIVYQGSGYVGSLAAPIILCSDQH